jgi:ankyrin repeat protein
LIDKYSKSLATGSGRKAVVKLLLEKGAELEPKDDEYGVTPLWLAAANGHEAVVKLLLEKGAELESKDDKCGCTPLLFCCIEWVRGGGEAAAREGC